MMMLVLWALLSRLCGVGAVGPVEAVVVVGVDGVCVCVMSREV